ncbi:MAG: baseplate multidomain protein megatron [Brevirhabdus sp.]
MATIVFSAIGAAVGASFGGTVLGISSLVVGRAVGATLGQAIDQRLLGAGAPPVETGKMDRFHVSGASEGTAVARVYGRYRVPGQVIWASDFVEATSTSGGGKGAPQPKVTQYSYSVSLALGLCAGEILRVGRVWADGQEISPGDLNMRVYKGDEAQQPDPKIEAIEGSGAVPAYRGLAYVVLEDLQLGPFGNRVPQLSFEVIRPAQPALKDSASTVWGGTRAVAMIPGTGDYALATTPVYSGAGLGEGQAVNINAPGEGTDFTQSLDALGEEVPNCESVSLVVSWFADDLRCGQARLRPMVEQTTYDGAAMPWEVSGVVRNMAEVLGQVDGRPVYGGTPCDQSVIEAIRAIRGSGKAVMFYPFVLMDILAGNGKPDPWSAAGTQPALPWRGRITLSKAPGQDGSPDQSAQAAAEVAGFLGTAGIGDFSQSGDTVGYDGPSEWSYRRFILHYAHLCALAGGVDAFCIGSELRSLTQIRDAAGGFPTVAGLRALAADVRAILGPDTKIGYAADWSEYFGYHPLDGSGDVLFHLDPLWADPEIDFVGIDNYMPLSDWRDGETHLDAEWGDIHDPGYLMANIEGGEGYDWFYPTDEARALQIREPIEDGQEGEDWVFRYKDFRNWWSLPHHERIGGVRQPSATAWTPRGKPIWFTEIGCPAVDKGTNQPNVFLDERSAESALPYHSNGHRDELIQARYLEAMYRYWNDPANNPYSEEYDGLMVDMGRAHVWAWDARPFPHFPANRELWSDGVNYARGHWISGRVSVQPLADVIAEICEANGVVDYDVSAVQGAVRGFAHSSVETGRAALQPLMIAYGVDAVERGGKLTFLPRAARVHHVWPAGQCAVDQEETQPWSATRLPDPETVGRVSLTHVEADGNYEARSTGAILSDDPALAVAHSELSLVLTAAEARAVAERWLAEARIARDTISLALPPSALPVQVGEILTLEGGVSGRYRVDRSEEAGAYKIEAVRVEPGVYEPSPYEDDPARLAGFTPPVQVFSLFLDLPLLTGDEIAHAPHVATVAAPWPGSVAVYSSASDDGYALNTLVQQSAVIGVTHTELPNAAPAYWDRGSVLRVKVTGGTLSSATLEDVLNGANAMAIGSGSTGQWEVFQFASATLVAPDTYDLSMFLRGQLGTDSIAPDIWPVGSHVVLLSDALPQISLESAQRGLARHYRVGPASRGFDDPVYTHETLAFDGVGLRPLSPVHLSVDGALGADRTVRWVRRTRVDGDSWSGLDVPLGEEREAYLVRVLRGSQLLREVEVGEPVWTYSSAEQAADGVASGDMISVAQISDRFGAGPFRSVVIDD